MSKFIRVFVTVLILALMAQGTFAQTTPPTPTFAANEFELVGVLESINQTSVVIAGFTINIATAEVERGLLPGDIVRVHATVGATGWDAREVQLFVPGAADNSNDNNGNNNSNDNGVDDNSNSNSNDNSSTPLQAGEFEITGLLSSIQGDIMVIGGQFVNVATAEMNDVVTVGDLVRVHVSNVGGQLVAREVQLATFGAAATCATTTPDGWRNYQIRGGDTLSQIAARAGITVEELARVNCINDIRIVVAGANLFVPRTGNFSSNSNDNGSDDNGNDNSGNDNSGNDNGDDNGNDNGSNDNGDDNGNDNGGNDNGSNDNGDDGGNDNGGGHGGGNDNGGGDNGNDND